MGVVREGWSDWRIRILVYVVGASIAATVVIYLLGLGLNPSTHFGAVFASWVAGLALFLVAGAFGVIVSLARPERESFDARARILFRRQSGTHIDYMVGTIKEALEPYAELHEIKVVIRQYHPGEKKFHVQDIDTMHLRGYLQDIDTTGKIKFDYQEVTLPPPGGADNRLVYVRLNGNDIATVKSFKEVLSEEYPINLAREETSKIESMIECWCLEGSNDKNPHTTIRYNKLLSVSFENQSICNVVVHFKNNHGKKTELPLLVGQTKPAMSATNLAPTQVYDYYIECQP